MGVARRLPVRLAVAALAVVGGGAGAAASSSNPVPAVGPECGTGVSGQGFRAFACMSGGARAGHPHPKELLVVRDDGSSVAYPAFRVGQFAVGDGEVVATYDLALVRVTRGRLVRLMTSAGLARALRVLPRAVMDVYHPTLDNRGDVYFFASVLSPSRSGCHSLLLERTPGGAIRRIHSSISRSCA
jgi:hypothetical protein